MDIYVVDHREAGWGGASASTALQQYKIDIELRELPERVGEVSAVLAYRACESALPELVRLAKQLWHVDGGSMESLYCANRRTTSQGGRADSTANCTAVGGSVENLLWCAEA